MVKVVVLDSHRIHQASVLLLLLEMCFLILKVIEGNEKDMFAATTLGLPTVAVF